MKSIMIFTHGMVYASLILVSCFTWGMLTAQIRGHQKAELVAVMAEEDYLTTIARAK